MAACVPPSTPGKLLVGFATPPGNPERGGSRTVRHWMIRTAALLPDEYAISQAVGTLVETASAEIVDAYPKFRDRLDPALPSAAAMRIDDLHCSISIEHGVRGTTNVENADLIATWTILRGFDAKYPIEDLQGVPKRLWWELMAKPSSS